MSGSRIVTVAVLLAAAWFGRGLVAPGVDADEGRPVDVEGVNSSQRSPGRGNRLGHAVLQQCSERAVPAAIRPTTDQQVNRSVGIGNRDVAHSIRVEVRHCKHLRQHRTQRDRLRRFE